MSLELVVFDLAGTTVYDGDAVNSLLRAVLFEVGLQVTPEAVNRVMGLPKPEAIRLLISESDAHSKLGAQVNTIHHHFVTAMIRTYQTDSSVKEMPGTSMVFRRLHSAGVMVALNTGFDRGIADVLIARMGWEQAGLIDATITSDEVQRGRPFPDMIHGLMNQLNINETRRVVKVGDTPSDIQEGHNAGCGLVVGVTNGSHSRAQLEPYGAHFLLRTVAELPRLLGLNTSLEQADE